MNSILRDMENEYVLSEKQLDIVSKAIFSINSDTNIIEHEIMQLGTHLENLGLYINELDFKLKENRM